MNLKITNINSKSSVTDFDKNKTPEYAFVGRSNVGKSSLINFIAGQKIAYTSSKPGKTQLINYFEVNSRWNLVDLPGYGYAKLSKKKREEISLRNNNYLKKIGDQLVCVFYLVDIRISPQKIDLERMTWLVQNEIYFIRTFTKCDKLSNSSINLMLKKYDANMRESGWINIPETIVTSAKKKKGRNTIINRIKCLNQDYFEYLKRLT